MVMYQNIRCMDNGQINKLANRKDLFIYCWLIAQSTAQGHLGAFHKFKFCTQLEYNTKQAHYINVKHTNMYRSRKKKKGQIKLGVPLTILVWRFNTRLKKLLKNPIHIHFSKDSHLFKLQKGTNFIHNCKNKMCRFYTQIILKHLQQSSCIKHFYL